MSDPATKTEATDPKVLLTHHLKKLKLPTVLAEYERQARQCAEQGVDHPRYLLRLAELELIERERRMVERRVGREYRVAKPTATSCSRIMARRRSSSF